MSHYWAERYAEQRRDEFAGEVRGEQLLRNAKGAAAGLADPKPAPTPRTRLLGLISRLRARHIWPEPGSR